MDRRGPGLEAHVTDPVNRARGILVRVIPPRRVRRILAAMSDVERTVMTPVARSLPMTARAAAKRFA
jgi:hypothetical protein